MNSDELTVRTLRQFEPQSFELTNSMGQLFFPARQTLAATRSAEFWDLVRTLCTPKSRKFGSVGRIVYYLLW
ncbi:hypothetical protein RSOLAG1IB_01418 [Rhizoctonia solani AG-1 IB]|jgi:hypothetical protein|uniref:Uncharacterized protein n=1 Tax=Thanatephorus cucumeris (strain AG1-IB / isolate 7/3/14) TaxID=1108050 RepID=A0A0B7FGS5_THACB|nr:hypothetical protein RSOLAG1IB_01418 [Rhizoctonia solani AG-1 IB]